MKMQPLEGSPGRTNGPRQEVHWNRSQVGDELPQARKETLQNNFYLYITHIQIKIVKYLFLICLMGNMDYF